MESGWHKIHMHQKTKTPVLEKAPKAIMMLADKSPKVVFCLLKAYYNNAGYLTTIESQQLSFNYCLIQEKGEQELQSKVPNNSGVCGVM